MIADNRHHASAAWLRENSTTATVTNKSASDLTFHSGEMNTAPGRHP